MKQEIRYVVVLTLISVVAAALLAIVNQVTADPIAQARRAKTLNALQKVLPPFDNEPDQEMIQVEGSEIYPARKDGKLVGVAVKVTDPKGYAGDVTFMVGLKGDPNAPIVNGYDLLAHKETPGLGTKLADEPFIGQFNELTFPADGLKVVKDGGTIDAITGATISSRTATNSVNKAVELYKEKAAELASGAAADPAAEPAAPAADPAAEPAPAEEPTAVPAADPAAGSDDGDDKVNEGESPEGEQEVDNV